MAVGEHLILGGDNLDLALAHHLEARLAGEGKLEPRPWAMLVRQSQKVKEVLLGNDAPERITVNVAGSGSKLLGGGLRAEVTRDEVRSLLLDGFFPQVAPGRQAGQPAFGFPGIRAPLCAGSGGHPGTWRRS